jgi:hypothetical protein
MLKNDANSGKSYNGQNLAHQVKTCLDELGLPYVFIDQNDTQVPLNVIRTRIHDQYKQQWRSSLEVSSRLQYYCKIKETLEFEMYLDVVDDPLLRKKLTRFRLSSHNLAIETGRYDGTPKDLRICTNCNIGVVESEYHFLLVCSKFADSYFCHWPTVHKFKTVLSQHSKNHTLGRYILEAGKRRS